MNRSSIFTFTILFGLFLGFASCNSKDDYYKIGESYMTGQHGKPKDTLMAVDYFTKGSITGCAKSQVALGNCYYSGYGVPQSYDKAIYLYQRAIDHGSAQAYSSLGSCYLLGHGVPMDEYKAVAFLQKGADKGDATSQVCLAQYRHLRHLCDRMVVRFGSPHRCLR
jgi:TPR repeat protein